MDIPLHIVYNELKNTLKNVYSNAEIQQLSFIIFEKTLGLSKIQSIGEREYQVSENQFKLIRNINNRLLNHEPIEYIINEAEFYGLSYKVDSNTLIPRPETEELVDWIIKSNNFDTPKILDIGTGSGCIAITLNKMMANSHVFAIDISKGAINIAKENDALNNTHVQFIEHDILNANPENLPKHLDILVSNPPYVRESEKQHMQNNVLHYEPQTALFVDDNDPLIFYSAIAKLGKKLLKPDGKLFFEINEALALEVANILKLEGYSVIEIRKDINGKDRMVKGQN